MNQQKTPNLFDGRTVLSGNEAAQYLGMSYSTFKHHVYVEKAIPHSAMIGNRRCFTRTQLDDYRKFKYTNLPFDITVYTVKQAAKYLGITVHNMGYYIRESQRKHLLVRELVGASGKSRRKDAKGGGTLIFTRQSLDSFKVQVLDKVRRNTKAASS